MRVPLLDVGTQGDGPDDELAVRPFRRFYVSGIARFEGPDQVMCLSVEAPWTRKEVAAWATRVFCLAIVNVALDVRSVRDVVDTRLREES